MSVVAISRGRYEQSTASDKNQIYTVSFYKMTYFQLFWFCNSQPCFSGSLWVQGSDTHLLCFSHTCKLELFKQGSEKWVLDLTRVVTCHMMWLCEFMFYLSSSSSSSSSISSSESSLFLELLLNSRFPSISRTCKCFRFWKILSFSAPTAILLNL